MEANTLYYTLSAIPQVLGAIATIIVAVIHFRIQNIKELLIGEGKYVKEKWGRIAHKFEDPNKDQEQEKRLEDAINRRSIPDIKKDLKELINNEKKHHETRLYRPYGLQYLYEDRFCVTEHYLKKLNRIFIGFIVFSFFTIIASIVSLAMTDSIILSTCLNLKYWVLWINVGLFFASLVVAFFLMRYGMSDKTAHETYIPSFESADKQSTQADGVNPPTNTNPKQ